MKPATNRHGAIRAALVDLAVPIDRADEIAAQLAAESTCTCDTAETLTAVLASTAPPACPVHDHPPPSLRMSGAPLLPTPAQELAARSSEGAALPPPVWEVFARLIAAQRLDAALDVLFVYADPHELLDR